MNSRHRFARSLVCIAAHFAAAAVVSSASSHPGYAADQDWSSGALGGQGGLPFSARCEGNAYLAGLRVRMGDDMDAISPICGHLLPDGSRGQLDLDRPAFGGGGGSRQELLCPGAEPFVRALRVGAEGRDTIVIDWVAVQCGPITGPLAARRVAEYNELSAQGTFARGTISDEAKRDHRSFECPDGMALAGIHGRSGAMVDALGVICGRIIAAPPRSTTFGKHPAPPPTPAQPAGTGARETPPIEAAPQPPPSVQGTAVAGTSRSRGTLSQAGKATLQTPALSVPPGGAVQRQLGATSETTHQLLCRGWEHLRVERLSLTFGKRESGTAAESASNDKVYAAYFLPHSAGTDAKGTGLQEGSCAFVGRPWGETDAPAVRFVVSADTQIKKMQHGPASSPETGLKSPDQYWRFIVEKRNGYFEAKSYGQVAQAAGAIPIK